MKNVSIFVGLDVHKDSIDIALVEEDRKATVRFYGTIGGDLTDLEKAVRKIKKAHPGATLHFVYEAGPCGYGIYRYLTKAGHECLVVAPSMIPKRSGNRIKTDRRDATMLASLHRAGELAAVFVPRAEDEAMRDLVRARQDAVKAERVAKQQLKGFLLRHGIKNAGPGDWKPSYMKWLAGLKMPNPTQQIVLQDYLNAVIDCSDRKMRFNAQIREVLPSWDQAPLVNALQAMRGVALMIAVTVVAELGDLKRFDSPRQLMSYLGLVPSEHSSGGTRRTGGITKAGNGHVRKVLVEAAQTYRLPARVSKILLERQEGLPKVIRDIAWKAQVRLCGRFRKMVARGKKHQTVVCATARELCAFMWAIAREVTTIASPVATGSQQI
jgi:transposase